MAKAIFFDEKKRYEGEKSVSSPTVYGRDDVALNPPGYPHLMSSNIPKKYWTITLIPLHFVNDNPMMNDVIEMTGPEKAIVDQEIADEQANQQEFEKNIDNWERKLKTLGKLTFKEINKLRVKDGDPAYTWSQFRAAAKAEW